MTTLAESVPIHPVHSITCYICLDNIVTMRKTFGIQNNCDHVFCFDCLSRWRYMSVTVDKDTAGRCPICRVRSTFVAPSWRCFTNTADKYSLISAHRQCLKAIACRNLARYGWCRYGRRCYYNHSITRLSSAMMNRSNSWNRQQAYSSTRLSSNTTQITNERRYESSGRSTYYSYRYRPY